MVHQLWKNVLQPQVQGHHHHHYRHKNEILTTILIRRSGIYKSGEDHGPLNAGPELSTGFSALPCPSRSPIRHALTAGAASKLRILRGTGRDALLSSKPVNRYCTPALRIRWPVHPHASREMISVARGRACFTTTAYSYCTNNDEMESTWHAKTRCRAAREIDRKLLAGTIYRQRLPTHTPRQPHHQHQHQQRRATDTERAAGARIAGTWFKPGIDG